MYRRSAFAAPAAASRWTAASSRRTVAHAGCEPTPGRPAAAAVAARVSRRAALAATVAVLLGGAAPARAGKPTLRRSKEEILEERRLAAEEGLTPEEIEERRALAAAEKAEEKRKRLEKQRELMASRENVDYAATSAPDKDKEIEANLRANYYYPTAKKRYLPRIKRVADQIDLLPGMIRAGDWKLAQEFTNDVVVDAVGPMKLYASALSGQGLSLSGAFLKSLEASSDQYENAAKKMKAALNKKDTTAALAATDKLTNSLQEYRVTAKINTPDGGVGEVPSDLRVGSGFGNNNPMLYERNYRNSQVSPSDT